MIIVSVRDTVADYFLPPYFARNGDHASRMFISSLGDSFVHRDDFDLYAIGTFDENTGEITSQQPEKILAGLSIAPTLDPRMPPAAPSTKIQDPIL